MSAPPSRTSSRADDELELDRDPPEPRDPIHVGRRAGRRSTADDRAVRDRPRFTRLDCFGLAGEAVRLTPAKRVRLLEAIVEEHDNQVPVPAGVATEAENTSVRLARELANAGADGLVIPPR
jgi:Dihydrodipicolinate synthetase family